MNRFALVTRQPSPGRPPLRQRGVVLFIALIMLVAMTMAGLALMRGIGSGLGITSNLAFKQIAGAQADLGVENARTWLVAQTTGANLNSDLSGSGGNFTYYSSWDPNFSPATFDWENNSQLVLAADASGNNTGNEVRVVIHRVCESPGLSVDNAAQKCAMLEQANFGSKGGGSGGYEPRVDEKLRQPFYRVTARVRGPRNTLSYTQVIVY